jgi:SAM-dependent methyltransferase
MPEGLHYSEINARAWDTWAEGGCIWSHPLSHEEFVRAKNGESNLYLTPKKPIPEKWLSAIKDCAVLGLASGGGQQCPILTALGGNVTVFDYSKRQLGREATVAKREGYHIELVHGDISKVFPFGDATFDIIVNPVSTSYVADLDHIWTECFRVLKSGGRLMSGFANPDIYAFEITNRKLELKHKLPFKSTDLDCYNHIETDGVQFSHSLVGQIGGQLKAGFSLIDIIEDSHPDRNLDTGYNTHIGQIAGYLTAFIPTYFATLSMKPR